MFFQNTIVTNNNAYSSKENSAEDVRGGSKFMDFAKKVGSFVKQHKLISRGAAALAPHAGRYSGAVGKVGEISRMLGLGLRVSGSGLKLTGNGLNVTGSGRRRRKR